MSLIYFFYFFRALHFSFVFLISIEESNLYLSLGIILCSLFHFHNTWFKRKYFCLFFFSFLNNDDNVSVLYSWDILSSYYIYIHWEKYFWSRLFFSNVYSYVCFLVLFKKRNQRACALVSLVLFCFIVYTTTDFALLKCVLQCLSIRCATRLAVYFVFVANRTTNLSIYVHWWRWWRYMKRHNFRIELSNFFLYLYKIILFSFGKSAHCFFLLPCVWFFLFKIISFTQNFLFSFFSVRCMRTCVCDKPLGSKIKISIWTNQYKERFLSSFLTQIIYVKLETRI